MKLTKRTKQLMKMFLNEQDDTKKDEWYNTDRQFAEHVFEQFEEWLKNVMQSNLEATDE